MHGTRARCLPMRLLLVADSKERRCAVCGIRLKNPCNMERKQQIIIPPNPTHTHIESMFFKCKFPIWNASWTPHGDTSDIAIVQPGEHPRTSPPGSRVSEHMPLYPSCIRLPRCSVSRALATGALEAWKIYGGRTWRIAQAWAVLSYYTHQLMTPCSNYFSGRSTLNGTPGGNRWARVLCRKIGWLSEPLHRVDADCSGCTNLEMQTHGKHEKIPLHRKHTTKPTSARRPRPPRDGP